MTRKQAIAIATGNIDKLETIEMRMVRHCEMGGCDEWYYSRHKGKKYCSVACARRAAGATRLAWWHRNYGRDRGNPSTALNIRSFENGLHEIN